MTKTIALVGGNEFRADCIPMDGHILRLVPQSSPRVLIVPTAAAHQGPEMAAQNGFRHFSALGATASRLMAITRADWQNDEFVRATEDADLFYLTGGDPGYLLQTVRGTTLLDAILRRCDEGAVLAGSSAGAMVLGDYMRQGAGGWAKALGVVPGVAVLPHYRAASRSNANARPTDLPDGVVILGISEATGCVSGDDGSWDVLGAGSVRVADPNATHDYRAGDSFVLSAGINK